MAQTQKERLEKQKEQEELPFNFLGLFYLTLNETIQKKINYAIANDYDNWNDCLRNVLSLISWRTKRSEEFEQELEEIDKMINGFKKSNTINLNRFNLKKRMYRIDRMLMDIVGKNFLTAYGGMQLGGIKSYKSRYPDIYD